MTPEQRDHIDWALARVLAEPHDDGPRLVYADACEDAGLCDRAAFVQVQVELATKPACPDWCAGDPAKCRTSALQLRERKLLDHNLNWVQWGCLSPLAPIDRDREVFRRGFVESLTIPADDWMNRADVILAAHPVTEVRLTTTPEMDVLLSPDGFEEYRLRGRSRWVGVDETSFGSSPIRRLVSIEWPRIAFKFPGDA